jgi:hypothetical protein
MSEENLSIDEYAARALTNERLADDLLRLADDVRFVTGDERAARLREAAGRLTVKRPNPQILATLTDGSQVAYMNGAIYVRSTIGGGWPLPLEESSTPHQPGTWYRGNW